MVFFNYTTMQMTAKIVYYGPGLCGKTTNLHHIHVKTAPKSRGEMVSLETETDRTLFFDLLPLDVGVIGGMKVRLQLYTVPGQVFYNATRKLVLKGVDGIVFVVDSQIAMLDANLESYHNLKENLAELGLTVDQLPLVFQFNKRDIRNIHPIEKLTEALNPDGHPSFEAAALHGIGVFETLKAISRMAIASVRKKVQLDAPGKKPAFVSVSTATPAAPAPAPVPAPVAAPVAAPVVAPVAAAAPRPAPAASTEAALAALVPDAPEEKVEFAEEDTDKHVRPVSTKGQLDIHQELEKLRASTSLPSKGPKPTSKGLEKRLQDMLTTDQSTKLEIKRKASVDVPADMLKGATAMKIDLVFDGGGPDDVVKEAVTIPLSGNRRLERLTLHIDLELKGKG